MARIIPFTLALFTLSCFAVPAVDKPGVVYKGFQFRADKIPRIDGNAEDWSVVPDSYVIGMDQLTDSLHGLKPDPKDLDVCVRVS